MNRIEKLINEFCPDGVKKEKLKNLAEIGTGNSNRQDATEDGQYTFFVRSKDTLKSSSYEYDEEAIIIPGEGGIGEVFHYINDKYALHQRAYRIHVVSDLLDTKFLYHYMKSAFKKFIAKKAVSATVTSIRKPMIEDFEVPLPPLSIQSEIVHILDSFTLLTAELTAELTARQKQYAFYRDYLLDFSNEDVTKKIPDIDCSQVKTLRLDEVAQIYDGTHQTPNYKDSGIPFISVENIKDIYGSKKYISEEDFNKYKIKPQINDVFMTRIGSIGDCAIFDKQADLAYYVSLALIRPNTDIVISKYLKYVIESRFGRKELRKRTLVNAVPIKINKNDIGKIELPIPPLSVQQNIVKILDRFDKLNNDMSDGLPAEIEARKKQYEYYRDTLLSFDDKACSHIVKVERERERELTRIKAIKWLSIQELFILKNGYTPSKSKSEYWTNGTLPWFRMEDIRENGHILNDSIQHITPEAVKGKLFPANSIILATSATIGEHALITVDSLANQRFTYLTPKEEYSNLLNMKYVFYYFFKIDEWCKNNLNISSFASVDMDKFKKLKFPVPPLEEQERIVSILDRFDKLCNDISEGLPAEIEARQKQYEYYRDKLLTFKMRNS